MKLSKRQASPIKNLILVCALDNMPLCFFGGGGARFLSIMELNPSHAGMFLHLLCIDYLLTEEEAFINS